MKLFIITFLCWLGISAIANAQITVKGSATGRVTDSQNKIVEFATITLLKSKDSTLVKGVLTDVNGQFHFENIAEGTYIIGVSQIGYDKLYTPSFVISAGNQHIDLKNLSLTESPKQLQEVAIKAAKPFIEQQIDKTR
jgi:hypothetical protein